MRFTTNTASTQTDKDTGQSISHRSDGHASLQQANQRLFFCNRTAASLAGLFIALTRPQPFRPNSMVVVHQGLMGLNSCVVALNMSLWLIGDVPYIGSDWHWTDLARSAWGVGLGSEPWDCIANLKMNFRIRIIEYRCAERILMCPPPGPKWFSHTAALVQTPLCVSQVMWRQLAFFWTYHVCINQCKGM